MEIAQGAYLFQKCVVCETVYERDGLVWKSTAPPAVQRATSISSGPALYRPTIAPHIANSTQVNDAVITETYQRDSQPVADVSNLDTARGRSR